MNRQEWGTLLVEAEAVGPGAAAEVRRAMRIVDMYALEVLHAEPPREAPEPPPPPAEVVEAFRALSALLNRQ